MGVIEDVRKVVQDLVAPELKSLAIMVESGEHESKLRDESLAKEAKLRDEMTHVKLEALSAKMDYQYASIMNALNLDKRLEVLERDKQSASA
jgi:hypothetical protein